MTNSTQAGPAVRYELLDDVVTVTLNRPETMNALSHEMLEGLERALADARAESTAYALVLRGEGRALCAGADLTFLQRALEDVSLLPAFVERINAILFDLETLPFPVIAMIDGFAVAGGFELLLVSDFVLAREDAKMGDGAATYGLLSAAGAIHRLRRKINHQAALDILYTGRLIDGREAERLGLVLRAVPADRLDGELVELLSRLRSRSRESLRYCKQAIERGEGLPMRRAVDEEMLAQLQYYLSSKDPAVGISAFLNKEQPIFGA
jgi:enoyl-CoA hydratase/carnithine racemase